MPSKPRTPRNTVAIRRLPKVGDTISIQVTVTRVAGDDEDADVTVQLPNGHRSTTRAKYLIEPDDA